MGWLAAFVVIAIAVAAPVGKTVPPGAVRAVHRHVIWNCDRAIALNSRTISFDRIRFAMFQRFKATETRLAATILHSVATRSRAPFSQLSAGIIFHHL